MKEITFEITDYCPHECPYCSSDAGPDGNTRLTVWDVENTLAGETYDRINLSGGEPLSHPQFYRILNLCKGHIRRGGLVAVYTNVIDMTARSHDRGHEVEYVDEKWRYADGVKYGMGHRPCKKCGKSPVSMPLRIESGRPGTLEGVWQYELIDACIAPIVKALQEGGIDMRSSCCGHGVRDGEITLQDGRTLIIRRKP